MTYTIEVLTNNMDMIESEFWKVLDFNVPNSDPLVDSIQEQWIKFLRIHNATGVNVFYPVVFDSEEDFIIFKLRCA